MSCVFQNIAPPPPPAPPLLWGGGHTRQGERGVGVNILEVARHSFVLYLYQILFGLSHLNFHSLHCVPHIRYVLLSTKRDQNGLWANSMYILPWSRIYLTVWICIQYLCSSSAEAVRILEHFVPVFSWREIMQRIKNRWKLLQMTNLSSVKGSLTRDFQLVNQCPRGPLSIIRFGLFRFFPQFCRDIREWMFITVVRRGKKPWRWTSRVRLSLTDNPFCVLRQIIPLVIQVPYLS